MATLMDHTAGKCACGHYHPKHADSAPVNVPVNTNPNIVDTEWANIWDWVSAPLNNVSWEFWVSQGQPEPKAQ